VFGVALGYEDLNDHDGLRRDPVDAEPARTVARDRHALEEDQPRPAAIEALFVDPFLGAHARPPKELLLDLDATDDPLHGHQEGRCFHGYYDGYCYLPALCVLRPASAGGQAQAVE